MNILTTPKGQPSILTERFGKYAPDGALDAAETAGAWQAWKKTVGSTNPPALVRTIADSGLRGRGGGGYSTGAKWRAAAAEPADERYVVANGFEADPGARPDRTLMENDPHAIVEGLALAAYAIGARRAYIALRERSTLARERLEAVVRQAEEQGYIGSNAMDTGVDVHIEVVALPGGMFVGEETVLLR